MYKLSSHTFEDNGLLIETSNGFKTLTVKISHLDTMKECFNYTFKLYGSYENQENDLIEDAIDMYHRNIKR